MKRFRIFNFLVIVQVVFSGLTKLTLANKNAGELRNVKTFVHSIVIFFLLLIMATWASWTFPFDNVTRAFEVKICASDNFSSWWLCFGWEVFDNELSWKEEDVAGGGGVFDLLKRIFNLFIFWKIFHHSPSTTTWKYSAHPSSDLYQIEDGKNRFNVRCAFRFNWMEWRVVGDGGTCRNWIGLEAGWRWIFADVVLAVAD